ncbi:MAG: transcriptional repressor [Oscillospiraceae bacterium]|nr:transcriptional repressor [Oscillospiraceae bacterium]
MQQRYSKKREAILELLRSVDSHPSADWIYQKLKPEFPDLSLGTVYRNLAAFRDDGTLATVGVVAGQDRFDGNTAEHPHFVCEKCGAVLDVTVPGEITADPGPDYTVHRCDVTLKGLCPACTRLTGQADPVK